MSNALMTQLAPCPDTPNCVSTLAEDRMHGIAPLTFDGPPDAAKARLLAVIRDMPRAVVVEDAGDYIHAEFRSRIFRFVDDVEFVVDGDAGVIHFRSAARAGAGDFGVNRKRMEAIRVAFAASELNYGSP